MANLFSDPVISRMDYLSAQRTLREVLLKRNWSESEVRGFIYRFIDKRFRVCSDGSKIYNLTVAKPTLVSRMATKQDILNYAARGEFEKSHFYSWEHGLRHPPNAKPNIQNGLMPEDDYCYMMYDFCHERILQYLIKRINERKEIKACELDFLKENQQSLYKLYQDDICFTIEEKREICAPSQSIFS